MLFPTNLHLVPVPATPTVADMQGAHIRYIRCRPYDRLPIIETGTVTATKTHNNILYLWVKPDSWRSARWVSEFNFLNYVHQPATNQKALA